MKTTIVLLGSAVALACILPQVGGAVSPTSAEMGEVRQWVAAKFEGLQEKKEPQVGLYVLANLNTVQSNARNAKPLQISDRQYVRGLYCHAHSKVVVRLPGHGKSFTATVGVDSNDQTRPGRGSIVFSVSVGGTKKFESPLMREGTAEMPVRVDLAGATEFVLEITDGGDGIACDQGDWADAKVTLADGKEIWLGDMELVDSREAGFDTQPFFSFVYGGRDSAELLENWRLERSTKELDAYRTQRTLTYTDPETGLVVRCAGVEWKGCCCARHHPGDVSGLPRCGLVSVMDELEDPK